MKYLLPLLLFCNTAFSQNREAIDSLKLIISESTEDTVVCEAYLQWGGTLYLVNPDSSAILWLKAGEIAEKNLQLDLSPSATKSFSKMYAEALHSVGIVRKHQGEISEALDLLHKSLAIRERIGDKYGIALELNNIGLISKKQGDKSKALECYKRSLSVREEIRDSTGIAATLNNLGTLYGEQGDIAKSLEYAYKSLKIREEIGDKQGASTSLNNIGFIYKQQGNSAEALNHFEKSLKIREELGWKKGIAVSLNNIGTAYDDKGEIEKGITYHQKSLIIYEEISDKAGIAQALVRLGNAYCELDSMKKGMQLLNRAFVASSYIEHKQWLGYTAENLGAWHLRMNNMDSAKYYLKFALKIGQELGAPRNIKRAAKKLSKVYKLEENFKLTLNMYELHIQMRDSINNEETQKATIRQQTKYEFEKTQLIKNQQLQEASRKFQEETIRRDNLQYSIIFLGILFVFGLVLSLGFIKLSPVIAEGLIFFAFLLLFEFLLVLSDPYVDGVTGGEPIYKLLLNAILAGLIFPAHAFFEKKLKKRLVK